MILRAFIKKPAKTTGLSRVYIVFHSPGKGKQWIPTKVKVDPKYWNQEYQRVERGHPVYKTLNTKLSDRFTAIDKAIDQLERDNLEITAQSVKAYLKPKPFIPPPDKKVIYLQDLLIGYKKSKVTKEGVYLLKNSYLRKYETIARVLDVYHKKIEADTFTSESLEAYISYLIDEHEIMNNTIHDHVRKIRYVLERAFKKGEIACTDFLDFNFKYVKPKPFWITLEEVGKLRNYKPENNLETDILKEWLLRCYSGLRWSDAHSMETHHFIKNDGEVFYDYTMIKTKLDHNILMSPDAVALLDSWNYKIPKINNDECNEVIKVIAEKAGLHRMVEKVRFKGSERVVELLPVWKLLTTHVARRTFARHWVDKGGDIAMLSKYLGHSSIQQTCDYIGYNTSEVNDEFRKIINQKS